MDSFLSILLGAVFVFLGLAWVALIMLGLWLLGVAYTWFERRPESPRLSKKGAYAWVGWADKRRGEL